MVKIKTGHYYLCDDGQVAFVAKDFTEEPFSLVNLIGKPRSRINKKFLLKYFKRDLGLDRKVVHILYSNKVSETK